MSWHWSATQSRNSGQVAGPGSYVNTISRVQVASNGGLANDQTVSAITDASDAVTVPAQSVPTLRGWTLLLLATGLILLGVGRLRRGRSAQ